MTTTTENKNLTSTDTAWMDATQSCIDYLCKYTGDEFGITAFIGDQIPPYKCNLWTFIISGGREQTQNYQCARPSKRYLADAGLLGQYESYEDAMRLAGRIMNCMPAYEDPTNDGTGTNTPSRGIQPNVGLFELTMHPEIFTRTQDLGTDKEPNIVQYWMLFVRFRVEYCNSKS